MYKMYNLNKGARNTEPTQPFEILFLANFEFFALLRVPPQASWGACDVAASFTRIFQVFVHGLLVDLQVSLQCCFVVTLGAFESYSLVFIVFVCF